MNKGFDYFSRLLRDEHSIGDVLIASSATTAISAASVTAALVTASIFVREEHLVQRSNQRLCFVKGTIFCLYLYVHLKIDQSMSKGVNFLLFDRLSVPLSSLGRRICHCLARQRVHGAAGSCPGKSWIQLELELSRACATTIRENFQNEKSHL